MKKNGVRQDQLDNLADALTEDILNTPDGELLREVEEDYGDPRALANKFDHILERAEKQVFGTARSAAAAQVRSRWVKGIFDLGSRLSEFLSSLRPRTLAWSATAAVVAILVQAAVITAVLVKEQGASRGPLPAATFEPGVAGQQRQTAAAPSSSEPPMSMAAPPTKAPMAPTISDEKIAALVAGGRQLMVAGDISNARLLLQQAADAGNATAALELGATYDPLAPSVTVVWGVEPIPDRRTLDVVMARKWYEKARDLGSAEAAVRLERLSGRDQR